MDLRGYTPEKWKILGNRVLVREHEVPYGSKNIVVIKNVGGNEKFGGAAGKRGQFAGEVVVIGPGKYTNKGVLVPPSHKIGDKVIFGLYSGRRLNIHKPVYWLLEADKVLGVVDKWPENFSDTSGRKLD